MLKCAFALKPIVRGGALEFAPGGGYVCPDESTRRAGPAQSS
jgi:hypothetical protein